MDNNSIDIIRRIRASLTENTIMEEVTKLRMSINIIISYVRSN